MYKAIVADLQLKEKGDFKSEVGGRGGVGPCGCAGLLRICVHVCGGGGGGLLLLVVVVCVGVCTAVACCVRVWTMCVRWGSHLCACLMPQGRAQRCCGPTGAGEPWCLAAHPQPGQRLPCR